MNNSRNFAYGKPGLFLAKGTISPIAVVSILTSNPCLAQITPDTTLGNQNSRVTTGVNIQGNQADLIEGGVQRGSNLYHSFREFNVKDGQRVYFANPTGVDNIFSRVTGINPTHILGTLGVNGAANLFLLNPKGIIFGPNAQLKIEGSFLATTANSFKFLGGSKFSATNPQAPPLLTMSVPVGVQFGSQPAADITSQGELVVGKDLTLNAGNLDLQGKVQAPRNLTLQAQGSVYLNNSQLDTNNNIYGFGEGIIINASNQISIKNSKITSRGNFGRILIGNTNQPQNVTIDNSRLDINNTDSGFAGVIIINASNQISIKNSKITSLGNFGRILIGDTTQPQNVTIDNSRLDINNTDSGFAGVIIINASNQIFFTNNSKITSRGNFGRILIGNTNQPQNVTIDNSRLDTTNTNTGSGFAGGIIINASNKISLDSSKITSLGNFGQILIGNTNQPQNVTIGNSQLNTTNTGSGLAGGIIINASNQISLDSSNILSQGYLGIIIISTGKLFLNQQSEINTDSKNSEIAGYISINAREQISLDDSKISSTGNNGWIFIGNNSQPKSIIINSSTINTNSNKYLENAGYISINARDQISLDGSKISSEGNDGYINIFTGSLSLTNRAQINSSLTGKGNRVGIISIKADNIFLQGDPTLKDTDDRQTGIFTQIGKEGELLFSNGKGNIRIDTDKLIITDGARLSADTYGKGDAGNITVNAQQIELKNQGRIISVVRDGANGNSGNIELNSRTVSITDDAFISVSNRGEGNAGNVTINATDSVLLERKGFIASSVRSTGKGKSGNININTNFLTADGGIIEAQNQGQGDGGDINITAQNLLLRRQSKITATAGSENNPGNGGRITINAKDGFVIAVASEDNDIIANAFGGQGGRINITANRILGFQNQGKLSSEQLRNLDKNGISDISASSDVGENGEVSLNTLSIDPTQGLVQLPTNLVDTSRLIAQGCDSNSNVAKGKSEFVITGRGGLPPSPDDTLKPGAISPEWVVNNTANNSNNSVNMSERNFKQLSSNNGDILVEAVGMVRSANGDIVFTAQPTTATGVQSGLSSQVCGVVQGNVKP